MIATLLPLMLQVADPALFAPPLERDFTIELEQARSVAQVRGVYRSHRTVRFQRDRDGLVAVLTIGPPEPSSGGASDDLFQRAMTTLAGQTLRFRLDTRGAAVGLDELDAHWRRLVETIAAIAADGRGERHAAPLRSFPPAARLRFLATMLNPILPDVAAHLPGERPVTIAVRSPAGAAVNLAGRERVARRGDGTLQVSVDVAGDDGRASVTLIRRDVLDPATGLRISHEERRRTVLLGASEEALTVEERWTIRSR